jgi:hypothetical protein
MPMIYRGYCPECGHEWDGLRRSVVCGHIDFQKPETYRSYSCPRCVVDLYVPRRLTRSAWVRWVSENASELTRSPLRFAACELGVRVDQQALGVIARSPLLFRACERVASILAQARSRYVAVSIDIGTMACPDCGDPLTVGDPDTVHSVCPECESRAARWVSEFCPEIVLVDYSPLDDSDVRRVIHHLKDLAERPKEPLPQSTLALPTIGCRSPLWDRELDGSIHTDEHHMP